MPVLNAYQSTDRSTWTRIQMLVMLYARGIEHLDGVLRAIEKQQRADEVIQRTRAAAIAAAIRSGINTEYGEIPTRIDQLIEFVQSVVVQGDAAQIRAAKDVMQKLYEGFEGIRNEANRLEVAGELPPLEQASTVNTTL